MAKKSISDIVLRAVVDTSGVAAGLNNIGSQVAGRSFGTGQGGPTGAAGAAGGFVSPYGAAPGGLAAAGAAAAAGIAIGRGRAAAGRPGADAVAGVFGEVKAREMMDRAAGMTGLRSGRRAVEELYPGVSWHEFEAKNGKMKEKFYWQERFDLAKKQGEARQKRIAELLPGVQEGIRSRSLLGAINQNSTRIGAMMGLGRFAPLGVPGLALGAATVGGTAAINLADSMYGRYQDISRFRVGPDRLAASQLRRTWTPAGEKAPLSFMDRLLIEGRKANQGQATLFEKGVGSLGQMKQGAATQVGRATAGDVAGIGNVLWSTNPVTFSLYQGYLNMKRLLAG